MSSRLHGAVFALALVLAAPLMAHASPDSARGLVVHTQGGNLRGIDNGSVSEWRGIPYAAPPVGSLRWRAPRPAPKWHGVRNATEFAQPCIQVAGDWPSGTRGSEDCLYLNVFAPEAAVPGSRLPVMVHLHPGGNAGFGPYTDATAMVKQGVIVVTLAYRLGVFGFVGHPELSAKQGGHSGEYGMLDQLAALRWVQDNIKTFGGDPANVTLFGSSAGSFDTVALMASPLSKGLFARASVQGEPVWGLDDSNTIRDAEKIGVRTARSVGCDTAAHVLQCLRDKPASVLVKASGVRDVLPWTGGAVVPQTVSSALNGEDDTPLLVGFDREEDRYNTYAYPAPKRYTRRLWIMDTNFLLGPQRGKRARSLYPPHAYGGSRFWSYITMETDAVRGCPTRRLANEVEAPTWRWLYTHTYQNGDSFEAAGRAAHLFEDPFLWGNFELFGQYTPTPSELNLSSQMTAYWTNFAKSGNPNGPGLPQWPRYDEKTESTLALDTPVRVISEYHERQCHLLDKSEVFP
jgi:para-nitrobenzyl esterase